MNPMTIIQLGDVHLPDCRDDRVADIKDRSLPSSLVTAVAPLKLMVVIRKIVEVCDAHDLVGVLICGDLTSRGILSDYEECVNYLNTALDLQNIPADILHAVPGNHDIDRTLCDPLGMDLYTKFNTLRKPWQSLGLPHLTVESVRETTPASSQGLVTLYSINSCIGCGEKRYLPASVQDEIKDILDTYVVSASPNDAFSLVGEQLDTPAFQHDDVNRAVTSIRALGDRTIPVVLSHHNVLPQAIPRLALYTEVVNGGMIRSRLAACGRPVLYCHGHIHTDPIDIVQDQRDTNGKLISISAPELIEGFNTITLHYSRADRPLGCIVNLYRWSNSELKVTTSVRIPLATGHSLARYRTDALQSILGVATGDLQRFNEFRSLVNDARSTAMQRQTLADALEEAEWLGLLEITNRNESQEHWQIRRREP